METLGSLIVIPGQPIRVDFTDEFGEVNGPTFTGEITLIKAERGDEEEINISIIMMEPDCGDTITITLLNEETNYES